MDKIFKEIEAERDLQDKKYGQEQDDTLSPSDWRLLMKRLVANAENKRGKNYRYQFIRIAALVIAAVQAIDRKEKESDGDNRQT